MESVGILFIKKKLNKSKNKNEIKLNHITATVRIKAGLIKIFSSPGLSKNSTNKKNDHDNNINVSNFIMSPGKTCIFCHRKLLNIEQQINNPDRKMIVFLKR